MKRETKELLKKNNESEKQINKENEGIYTDMIVYLRGADITEHNQEKVREDLIEMIVHGQERGDDIQKVIGDNYKEICDEIIAEMPKKTKIQKVMETITFGLDILCILGFIYIIRGCINMLISGDKSSYLDVTLGEVISNVVIVIVANVFVTYICKTALDVSKKNRSKVATFVITWIIMFVLGCVIFLPAVFLEMTVFTISIWVAALILVGLFVASKALSRKFS